jgi:phospholipase/carboxylesterase
MSLEKIILEPQTPAQSCVIWLHGLGADGHDFANLVPELRLPVDHNIRFVFPHAPVRPITLNQGWPMRGWYDIFGLNRETQQDESGIRSMAERIRQLIAEQVSVGLDSQKILLAGFSQGGALALYTALTHAEPLAGVLALSTYLPIAPVLQQEAKVQSHSLPVLMVHGVADSIIPLQFAEHSRDVLQTLGYPVTWQTYPMAHSVCAEEVSLIRQWLQSRLS